MALFGMTTKEWRDKNKDKSGNIRDYATINEKISQSERLIKLNKIAISQMKILTETNKKLLK